MGRLGSYAQDMRTCLLAWSSSIPLTVLNMITDPTMDGELVLPAPSGRRGEGTRCATRHRLLVFEEVG